MIVREKSARIARPRSVHAYNHGLPANIRTVDIDRLAKCSWSVCLYVYGWIQISYLFFIHGEIIIILCMINEIVPNAFDLSAHCTFYGSHDDGGNK